MTAPMKTFLSQRLGPQMRQSLERWRRTPGVIQMAVMPDAHLARDVCVGTVIATHQTLFPAAVGGDIGCGVATVAFDTAADLVSDVVADAIFDRLAEAVPILRHPRGRQRPLPPSLAVQSLSSPALRKIAHSEAAAQLGTLGRGNHFLELQEGPQGELWAMVHSGSRGMGQAIRAAHVGASAFVGLPTTSPEGRAYWHDMQWALSFARLSRARMLEAVAEMLRALLGAQPLAESWVDCEHNLIAQVPLGGRALCLHRKGATSALAGEPGLIPGSMGTPTFHTLGRGCEAGLLSSSHGAGRAMSRTAARRRITRRTLEAQLEGVYFQRRRAGALIEEAPGAYRNIHAVMRAQRKLVRTVRMVRPRLSYKGG